MPDRTVAAPFLKLPGHACVCMKRIDVGGAGTNYSRPAPPSRAGSVPVKVVSGISLQNKMRCPGFPYPEEAARDGKDFRKAWRAGGCVHD